MKRIQWNPMSAALYRNPFIRLRLALLLGFILIALGTIGFIEVEHFSFLDALYLTVITLSSVGYETVKPLDVPGKIFAICLILVGLGTAAWVFTTIIEVFVGEQAIRILTRKRMNRMVNGYQNHYIICGFGRIGQQIVQNYTQNKTPFVVIEQEPMRIEMLREMAIPHIEGDAADDETLKLAGIDRAAALIAVTPTDAITTFIVLSARGLRKDLMIVARADTNQNESKLLRAGASKVVSTHSLGGSWMGITAVNPAVTDFITAMVEADHDKFKLQEFTLESGCPYIGYAYGDLNIREQTGALVVAARCSSPAHFLPNPPNDLKLMRGDTLIAIGSPDQLKHLQRYLKP